jgi:hypothetical protein
MNGSSDPFADGGDEGDSGNPLAALGALLEASPIAPLVASLRQRQQRLLDASTPHAGRRWASLAALVLVYALRVWSLQGFYIVTYALGIYNLNLLLGFLTPQVSFFETALNFFSFFLVFQSIHRSRRSSATPSFSLNSFPFSLLSSLHHHHQNPTDRPRARGAHPPLPALRRVPPLPAEAARIQVLVGEHAQRRVLARRHAVPAVRRARLLADPARLLLRALFRDDAEADQAHDQAQVYPVLAGEFCF